MNDEDIVMILVERLPTLYEYLISANGVRDGAFDTQVVKA